MNHAADFWKEAAPVAGKCLAHPFVQGLGDGSLDREKYRRFIAQDAFFLEAFARGYAHCLASSPDRQGIYEFHRLLNGVFDELQLHARAAKELDIDLDRVEPTPAALEYTGFLQETIENSTAAGETLAAMTPCMRLYAYLGAELAGSSTPANPYAEWVDTYASQDFQELAELLETLLDRYGTGSAAERMNYQRAMELELQFFAAAYEGV